jgi:hypothetical protein
MFITQNVNYTLQKCERPLYYSHAVDTDAPRLGRSIGYAAASTGMNSMLDLITEHMISDEIPGDAR